MTGTAGAQAVGDQLRRRLIRIGFEVHDYPFTFSTVPGRFAVSVIGIVFLLETLGAAALMNAREPGLALVVLSTVLLMSGSVAVLAPLLTDMLPLGRITAANLLAVKPGTRPRFIVMAHLDSKSQPLPLAFRGPAIVLALLSWATFTVLAILGLLDPVWLVPALTSTIAAVCILASIALILCWTANHSPGALDNASGLCTLIGLAERNSARNDVAYLITDAEELGLVGARSIARRLDPVVGIINVDGIDDHGDYHILERFGVPPRHFAPHLVAALLIAAAEMDIAAHRRDVPFGLLLDHIPLAQAQLPAVTLMRGSILKSMVRVHRPADSTDSLTGEGVEHAVQLISRALDVLRSEPAGRSL